MKKIIDLTGKKFGRLTVLRYSHKSGNKHYWLCKCDCGKEKPVIGCCLKSGNTKSCGCYNKEKRIETHTKHGMKNTKIYYVWKAIKKRCENPNDTAYKNYGGRGIKVCDEWKNDFTSFYNWSIKNGYKEGLSIDRIDNNGNYEPLNCRWATRIEQGRNTRKNRFIEYNGEKHCISEWSSLLGIKQRKIYDRLKKGWSIEKVFSKKRYETTR